MRVYLWVIFIICGLMGAYLTLVPIAMRSDMMKTATNTGPF